MNTQRSPASGFVRAENSTKATKSLSTAPWKNEHQVEVGSTIMLYERPFRVVGVYEPPGGGRLKIPLASMQDQVGSENRCNAILIACENPALQDEVAARIKDKFPDDQIIFTRDLPGDLHVERPGPERLSEGRHRCRCDD
jgi:hypothetical protein